MTKHEVAYTPKADDNIKAMSESDRAAVYHTVNLLRYDAFPRELVNSGKLTRVNNAGYVRLTPTVAFGYLWEPASRSILVVAGDPTKEC